jgi:aspartyl-tRNA(Asn)/glutamyl-tRNA(Gln) amidotransferase subunit B
MLEESIINSYELVCGLEVHAQLRTATKMFSGDAYEYGSKPNTQTSPVSLAHPGALPIPNLKAFELAVKMGVACNSTLHRTTYFSRKNYFYPDLPKGYQITQFVKPICTEGYVPLYNKKGEEYKKILLDKIIVEEDSGKSTHDLDPFYTLIDLNRSGVPLIEIVTQPCIHQPSEAYDYLTEIRQIVRYLNICDGNMEEGSLRCDANISVRKKGETSFRNRVEIKNINSIRNVQRAIEHEIIRQIEIYENGGIISQDTRGFDATSGTTYGMRSKELANDYRYFPEPDIPPFILTDELLNDIKENIEQLPRERKKGLIEKYSLSEYDADVITADKELADYFDSLVLETPHVKSLVNIIIGPIKSYLNTQSLNISDFNLPKNRIIELIDVVESGEISFSTATNKVFPLLIENNGIKSAYEIIEENNLAQVGDDDFLQNLIKEVLNELPDKVLEYKNGKKGLIGLFMGQVMKKSDGKADPKKTSELLTKALTE